MKVNQVVKNSILLIVSVLITLVLSEYCFTLLLFSDFTFLARFRQPYHFAKTYEDNFWKLYHIWDGTYKPPATPHPLLGWIGNFSRETYYHHDAQRVGHRQPVLLYGDSFAECASAAEQECFQQILNGNDSFSKRYYLLNYGVGGYGVDQILLLLKNSLNLFKNPLVVVGIFTDDLDRGVLSFRIGQKPYFEIEKGELVLHGVPSYPSPDQYLAEHPVSITSYLFRLWIHAEQCSVEAT